MSKGIERKLERFKREKLSRENLNWLGMLERNSCEINGHIPISYDITGVKILYECKRCGVKGDSIDFFSVNGRYSTYDRKG